ncbi:hypothetical protein DSAG12_03630 [Promethearchaeum syntrophicum]|uniref:Uncharacterized protein n=1 Tax=Promethearchaeum syntrophicum TaxID=2594042 RepID=A0A5B9DFA3_9ARCH
MAKKSTSKTKTVSKTTSTKINTNFKPDMEDIEILLQFEGRDVVKNGMKTSILGKFLQEFNRLVFYLAKFRGYINNKFPKSCFESYLTKMKKTGLTIIMKNAPEPEMNQLFTDNPYDALFFDLNELIEHIENDADNSFFKLAYAQPFVRITLLDCIQKLCPIYNTSLKISYSPIDTSLDESEIEFNFTEMLKTKIMTWIESEKRNLPYVDGYFIGYKEDIDQSIFWIKDLNNRELICEYDVEIHANLISSVRRFDLCRIYGTFIESPGKNPSIKNLIDILKLDEPEGENIDQIIAEIENDKDFVTSLDAAEEEVKSGKFLTREELLGGMF